jgi:hypothetical protein
MNLVTNHRTKILAGVLTLLFAMPSFALVAGRRRAVTPGDPNPGVNKPLDAFIYGHLQDAITGLPVAQAAIVVEGTTVTLSDKDGDFSLKTSNGRAFTMIAQRSGYQPASKDLVGVTGDQNVTLSMQPTAVLTLKDTDGVTHAIDFENAQFAYLVPFSGYVPSNEGNFCKNDGSGDFFPTKSDIKRIIGPAVPVTNSGCCKLGPVLQVTIEMKNGDRVLANFADSCFGSEVDFIGRDHVSGNFAYFNFTKIAEIVFP